ncbi:MAG: homocysteine S-methyltransferase family protein [Acidimicrobiia bacterium]|nr:homocysteine S-methyltransferase family protein [Acidimicrobiia bacterium]
MVNTITILDGGMGKELRRIGAPFRQPEWSALALLEAPDQVTQAHRNFIDAGAEVVITNTYAVVPFHIGAERFEARGRELVELAARLARKATADANRPIRVAGSLPPVCGSYVPDDFEPETAPDRWRTLIEPQIPHVDLWIGETISSTTEARVLLETLNAVAPDDKPVWLAFTLDDTPGHAEATLRSGEPLSVVAALLTEPSAANVETVLFNCSQPEVIRPALEALRPLLPDTPLGAYANAFAEHHVESDDYAANTQILERRDDLTAERYADLAAEWIDAGATVIGGCCDIYPEHIAALAARFGR